MQKILTLILVLLGISSLQAQAPAREAAAPASSGNAAVSTAALAKFETKEHNFGVLKFKEEAVCTFTFTNVSDKPIAIERVDKTCGCTTPTYSTEPIMPGEKGIITARYDTSREGHFFKTLTVVIGGQNYLLVLKGDVEPNPNGKSSK